jgi:hypothetical protein
MLLNVVGRSGCCIDKPSFFSEELDKYKIDKSERRLLASKQSLKKTNNFSQSGIKLELTICNDFVTGIT